MVEPTKRFDYKLAKQKFKPKSKESSQKSSENYEQVIFDTSIFSNFHFALLKNNNLTKITLLLIERMIFLFKN